MKVSGVILAAGKGTRMKSDLPKVLHSVLGQPMINYGQSAIKHLDDKYVVVGHKSELVINQLEPEFKSILQEEQLGTGHAVVTLLNSEEFKNDISDYVLIIPGDVPLLNNSDKPLAERLKEISTLKFVSNPLGGVKVDSVFLKPGVSER